jgi:hypothetical protein
VLPTPNKATGGRGGLFLKGRPIHVNKALGFWKYKDDQTAVPDEEFWHPQKQPDHQTAQFFTNQPTLAIETLTKFGLIRDLTAG